MNIKEWLDNLDVGFVTYDTYYSQIKCYAGLPKIPSAYFLPLAGVDIVSEELCKMVLDCLKVENKKIDEKYTKEEQEVVFNQELDTDCFFIQLNAGQVFDFWFGKKKYIENNILQSRIDCFIFDFWKYLREEITYNELKSSAKELNNTYEKISLEVN